MGIKVGFTAKWREKLREPGMFRVVLLNDDYTTMDFVVVVLEVVFYKTVREAGDIMLEVHRKGRAVVGVFTEDVARTKVEEVHLLAKRHQFPLTCVVEPDV
jgi:ATP-dependent Clp protease adaptor protein ClpS